MGPEPIGGSVGVAMGARHFGSNILSMTWMTPLSARTSGETTRASLTVTASADLVTWKRSEPLSDFTGIVLRGRMSAVGLRGRT